MKEVHRGLGQTSQRRANLEALRSLCREYENNCAACVRPATIIGFFWWCEQKAEFDLKGLDPEANAIHVGTNHRAKGLNGRWWSALAWPRNRGPECGRLSSNPQISTCLLTAINR